MKQTQLTNLFLDQSNDLFWMIDLDFQLIYANKRYLSFMREVSGKEKKLNESVFTEVIDEGYIETWKAYYSKALNGEHFEVEEHVYHQNSDQLQYTQVTFEPLTGEDDKIFAVACQSKDIIRGVTENFSHSEEQNRLIINSALDAIICMDVQGKVTFWNPSAEKIFGWRSDEIIGQKLSDHIIPENFRLMHDYGMDHYLKTGEAKVFNRIIEISAINKNGETFPVELTIVPVNQGKEEFFYSFIRDITERKKAEEKIKQEEAILLSEQRFKALVQEGSDLIRIIDAKGNFTYVSPTSTSILGIAPEEFIGKNIFDYIHPDDVAKALKCLQKITTDKKVIIAPIRFQNHEKEWCWMESVLTNMLDNPAVNGIVVNSRDISAKIEKEHKLKLFENLITNTNDAILITDGEPFDELGPRIIYVNEAFTKMTGYSAEEIIGKTPRILQGPNSIKEESSRLSTAITNWESCEITTINYKKNGEEFWINLTMTPVANQEGWYTNWVVLARDVTEQKIKEQEKELIAQISLSFNSENDLVFASNELCRSISDLGKFDWIELWTINLEKSQMQLFSHYLAAQENEKIYDGIGQEIITCRKSEGLPGIVWSKGEQLLLDNVGESKDFTRRDAAKKIGLKSVIGIPLFSNDEVIGVLNVGSKHDASYLNNYTRIFKRLEGFIGSMLNQKKLENDLSHLFNAIPDIICVMDFQGKFLKINKTGCDLLGYGEEQILYHNFQKFAHPDDKGIFINEVEGLEKEQNTFKFENRYITHSGNIVWLSWYCNSSLKEGLIYASAKNITQEVKNQKLLTEASQMARIGSWELDLANQNEDSLYWSSMIKEIFEVDSSFEPSLKDEIGFLGTGKNESLMNAVSTLINDEIEFDEEALLTTKKGNQRWVRCIGKSEVANNKCIKIYGSLQDIHERKLVTLELEKSLKILEDYKFALDQSTIIAFTDKKGIITNVNDNFCEISKYNREELIGKTHQLINSKHHPKEFFNSLWKTISSGKVWRGEIKNKTKCGSYYWVNTTIIPFLDEKNKPFQYLAIRFDITSIKLAEEEKNSIQVTLDNSLNEIYIFELETLQFSYVNKGALLNTGYSEPEIKGLTPFDIKPEFTASSFNQLIAPLVTNQKEKIIYFSNHKRKNGSIYPVETHLQLVTEGSNKRFLAIVVDITDRKKAEENIIQSNERFEKVTEATNDAIWDWDIEKQTYYRSKAFERFFGKDASGLFTESVMWSKKEFHPEDLDEITHSFHEAIANPLCLRWEYEYRIIDDRGKTLHLIDQAVIIRNSEGNAIRVVGAMIDISETKRMTLELRELNKSLEQYALELERSNGELEQFAFVASHDLQEPLRMISSFMDLLHRKYGHLIDEKGHQYIHYATDGAKRMRRIILDLLDYSRASKSIEEKEDVDINELLSEFSQLRRKIISEKSASISSNNLPILKTGKVAIVQILHCLLDNALMYTEVGTPPIIEINAVENEKEWEFSIKDNGIGIDPQFYDKIFVIFQRLHNSDQYEGTGIGLSIAKKYVEFLRGRIWLNSAPGEGTVFYFTIPKIK